MSETGTGTSKKEKQQYKKKKNPHLPPIPSHISLLAIRISLRTNNDMGQKCC